MKLNKVLFIPALIFSALVLSPSCNPDKLDLQNPNELLPEKYFVNAAQVQASVNACYGAMQTTGMFNRMMWYGNDNMAQENTCNPQQEADKRQYLDFSHDPTHGGIYAYWSSCYRGINKCNFVINNEDKIRAIDPVFLNDVMKDKYIGEAKFMRALYYFWLVDKFGGVPIYLSLPEDNQGLGKSTAAQVWAQIETDLGDAVNLLRNKADEESGRATRGAAYALLGKARLYQEKFVPAIAAFDSVKGYSLESIYFENFKEETENGPESIFEVQFKTEAGTSSSWSSDRTDEGLNEATYRGQEYGCFNWFNVFPSQDLWDEFESTAADAKYDNGVKTDPRRAYCIIANGDRYANNKRVARIANDTVWNNPQNHSLGYREVIPRRGWNKYQNYYKWESEGFVQSNYSGINMKVIRYADVLLMKAECIARSGGSLTDAVALMNLVRNRADVQMPLYGTTEMDNAGFPVGNEAEFMTALEHERKIELCGEQVRFPDLVRWNRLEDFMAEVLPTKPLGHQATFVFQYPKNKLWPIPLVEINANINLTTADQNPGY
jgi:hypothetical protein